MNWFSITMQLRIDFSPTPNAYSNNSCTGSVQPWCFCKQLSHSLCPQPNTKNTVWTTSYQDTHTLKCSLVCMGVWVVWMCQKILDIKGNIVQNITAFYALQSILTARSFCFKCVHTAVICEHKGKWIRYSVLRSIQAEVSIKWPQYLVLIKQTHDHFLLLFYQWSVILNPMRANTFHIAC